MLGSARLGSARARPTASEFAGPRRQTPQTHWLGGAAKLLRHRQRRAASVLHLSRPQRPIELAARSLRASFAARRLRLPAPPPQPGGLFFPARGVPDKESRRQLTFACQRWAPSSARAPPSQRRADSARLSSKAARATKAPATVGSGATNLKSASLTRVATFRPSRNRFPPVSLAGARQIASQRQAGRVPGRHVCN